MHSSYYNNLIIQKLDTVAANVLSGPTGTGDVNVTNASLAITNTALTKLDDCFDEVNGHVEVDINAFNGNAIATNTGVLTDGTQRVTIASNDPNLSSLSSCVVGNKVDVNLKTSAISLPITGAVTVSSGTVAISTLPGIVGEVTISGAVAVTNTPLTNLGTCVDTGNSRLNANITNASLAITNSALTTLNNNVASAMGSGVLNVGVLSMPTTSVTVGNFPSSQAVTVTSGNITAVCSGTSTVSGSVSITGTPNVNATCSGTVAVTNSSLTTLATNATRQSYGGLESLNVSEYKLIYKSHYPQSYSSLITEFESFTNATYNSSDGGINVFPVSTASPVGCQTRFNFLNGNNTWLIVFPMLCASTAGANVPILECGLHYYEAANGLYISIVNDYNGTTQPNLKYQVNSISLTNVSMSSWNVDIFNGAGLSGIDLTGATNKKYALSWFFIVNSSTNYCYVGIVDQGKLWVGHQFSIKLPSAIGANNIRLGNIGFRPYWTNNTPTASISTYSSGFEIYNKQGNYLNMMKLPGNFMFVYNAFNLSTTLFPFIIYLRGSNLSNSYIQLQKLQAKTTGTSDVGDFRIDVFHAVDNTGSITSGTLVNSYVADYQHSASSITGGIRIASFFPRSDNCICEDISWIDHKYFGWDYASTSGYSSKIYFTAVNISSSVNKILYFSISWFE